MANKEGLRKTDLAIVMNTLPDVCWTPIGGLMVPVPYNIIARFGDSEGTVRTVRMTQQEAFVVSSRIPHVVGNEAGAGGGIFSGVNRGYSRPIDHSPVVRMGGQFVIRHGAEFSMNCNGPDGPENTRGRAILIRTYDLSALAENNPALAENYPYSEKTFERIQKMNAWINEYAAKYGVPPGPVAGAIADEFNSLSTIDWAQDALIGNLPNSFIEGDRIFYFDNKLLNSFKNDLGPGNIKLETAWALYQRHPDSFPSNWNYADMVDYVQTDQGTAHLAALYVREAQDRFGPTIQGLPPELQEAVLMTAYKRGIENYEPSLRKALIDDPFRPGEGIRYLMQRDQIQQALNPDTAAPAGAAIGAAIALLDLLDAAEDGMQVAR